MGHLVDARHSRFIQKGELGEIGFPAGIPELKGIGDFPAAFVVDRLGGNPPIRRHDVVSTQIYPWNPHGERLGYSSIKNSGKIVLLPVFSLSKFERLPLGKVDVQYPLPPLDGRDSGRQLVLVSIKSHAATPRLIAVCSTCKSEVCDCVLPPFAYHIDQKRTNIQLN